MSAGEPTVSRAHRSRETVEQLQRYQLNSVSVFGISAVDLAQSALEQAHAVTIALGVAIDESTDSNSDETSLRPIHISRALDGINSLVSLAALALNGRTLS